MSSNDPFSFLGLDEKTATASDVRRAYAERLKTTRPDDDPEAFMALRRQYESAQQILRWTAEEAHYDRLYDDDDQIPTDSQDLNETETASVLSQNPTVTDLEENSTAGKSIVEELMEKVRSSVNSPWNTGQLDVWRSVVEDDRVQSIDDFQDLSISIRQFICEAGGYYGNADAHPKRADWISLDLLVFLNQHFGWGETRRLDYVGQSEIDFIEYMQRDIKDERYRQALRDNRKARNAAEDQANHTANVVSGILVAALLLFFLFRAIVVTSGPY